jgi:ribosome-associated translation inhibitor RaiA
MKLEDFINNFDFDNTAAQINPFARSDFMLVENPRLFTIGFNVSFNRMLEKVVFINGVEQKDINLAIDAIYVKMEQRLEKLKSLQSEDKKFFIDCKVSITIRQEEKPRLHF